ncbi:hypothetical protein EDB89DRAFT_2245959, partial [Lactarius sanguifluus]
MSPSSHCIKTLKERRMSRHGLSAMGWAIYMTPSGSWLWLLNFQFLRVVSYAFFTCVSCQCGAKGVIKVLRVHSAPAAQYKLVQTVTPTTTAGGRGEYQARLSYDRAGQQCDDHAGVRAHALQYCDGPQSDISASLRARISDNSHDPLRLASDDLEDSPPWLSVTIAHWQLHVFGYCNSAMIRHEYNPANYLVFSEELRTRLTKELRQRPDFEPGHQFRPEDPSPDWVPTLIPTPDIERPYSKSTRNEDGLHINGFDNIYYQITASLTTSRGRLRPPVGRSNGRLLGRLLPAAKYDAYEEKTKKDLLAHPLMAQLQTCNSPTDILAVLRTQVQHFESTRDDDKLTKWLNPTVNVLYAFSAALGEGVGLLFSPAKVIFAGAGVLLLAAKDVVASRDALFDIFERIESFFRRLETYIEVPATEAMRDIIVMIMVEVLGLLAIVTKEMKQGRARKYLKKLFGRTDIEDALSRLDKLTQEEARMAIMQVLKVAHHIDDGVKTVRNNVKDINDKINVTIEDSKETKALVQQTVNDMDETKRDQVRRYHRAW